MFSQHQSLHTLPTHAELLRRLDDIRIKDGAELRVSPNLLLRGFVSVPITFKKAAA